LRIIGLFLAIAGMLSKTAKTVNKITKKIGKQPPGLFGLAADCWYFPMVSPRAYLA